jgi:class 3 adenylate cyclase
MDERPVTRYVKARDGVNLAYRIAGDGPLDLLWVLDGALPVDLLWDEPSFAHVAHRLAGFSRTIWVTPRGFGGSGGQVLDTYVERIGDSDLSDLIDHCEAERVALVGSGVTGWFVIRYAHEHPDRVQSLVLIDSYAHYLQRPDYPVGRSQAQLDQVEVRVPEVWGSGATLDVVAPSRTADPLFRERYARMERLGQPPDQAATVIRRTLMMDVRDLLPSLRVPTLVLHRRGDRWIRVEAGRYLGASIPGAKYVELPGDDHLFFVGDADAVVDEVEEFLTGGHQAPEGEVVTATILFTDIVSSTEQSARLGHRRWSRLSEDHDAMVRSTVERYRGRVVKTTGDGFLVTFDAASRAVRAASEVVKAARAAGLDIRAGVHTGEVEVRPDDVIGLPVSTAKRVCDVAEPCHVFVTEVVKLQVAESGIETEDRGEYKLKGVPGVWRLFAVRS